MKAIQAIKKMVALGMGLTMVGATIFGASAAKLSDYPAPFIVNGTPASNLAIIVGDKASAEDVVGSLDILQNLQVEAKIKTASAGAPSQLVVQGDAVEIGSTSDLLEIGEAIGDVRETLTEVDLDMLKGGQIVTDQGSTEFNQYLRFRNDTGRVIFAEDERDRVGHYLYYDDGEMVFQWELEFEEGLNSEVRGNDLQDLEDEDITVLGQPFVIVDTDLYVANFNTYPCFGTNLTHCNPTVRLTFELIGGAVSAVLGENDKETYVVDGKEYEVEVLVISETAAGGEGSVKFRINGEITDELEDGETDVLADGTQIGIRDILATGKDIQKSIVQFYIGAYKVDLTDTDVNDQLFTPAGAEVNKETIEDSFVRVRGQFTRNSYLPSSMDGARFSISNIQYNLTADAVLGDMYIPPGTGVREQLKEPEGMLTPNWDIRYEGLMDTGVTLVRIDAAGDDEYDLEYTNQEGIFFDFPLASNELGNTAGNVLKYGDDDDDLWFQEFCLNASGAPATGCAVFNSVAGWGAGAFYISDDDFFVVSNCDVAAQDNTCFSHVLRYDRLDATNRKLTFTDLGTGTREVTYDAATFTADLVVGGVTYRVGVDPTVPTSGNIIIDLNGDGAILNCTKAIIGIQGEGLIDLGWTATPTPQPNNSSIPANSSLSCPADTTDNWINLTLRTLQKEFDEAAVDEVIQVNITQRATNKIGIDNVLQLTGPIAFSNLLDLEENDDIEQALSGYGVFFELFNPQSGREAEDLTVEYPLSQRGARVFVTGGIVTTTSVASGGVEKVQPIQIGAAKLASEVSDVTMYKAIVVGGPCANPIAAALLGNPEPCYESVPQNEAIVKLFEHANGNVALLINGRSAKDTRLACRAVATKEIAMVTAKEAKVTGASLAEIKVSAI